MNEEELALWRAVYAAYFVAEFRSSVERVGFDRSVDLSSAETAIAVADLAMQRLREWRGSERPDAGVAIDYL